MHEEEVILWYLLPQLSQPVIDSTKRAYEDWGVPIDGDKCLSMALCTGDQQRFTFDDAAELAGFLATEQAFILTSSQASSESAFRILNQICGAFMRALIENFLTIYLTHCAFLSYGTQNVHSGLVNNQRVLDRIQFTSTNSVWTLIHLSHITRLLTLSLYHTDLGRTQNDFLLMYFLFIYLLLSL